MDVEIEKCFGVLIEGEREVRVYMLGLEFGIYLLVNGGGKGLKLEL